MKSIGSSKKLEYILTAKVDFKSKKDTWIPIATILADSSNWQKLSGKLNLSFDPNDVKGVTIYVEGPAKTVDFLVDGVSMGTTSAGSGRPMSKKPEAKPFPQKDQNSKPQNQEKPTETQASSPKPTSKGDDTLKITHFSSRN